jgi:hypothetical protein
MFCPVCKAEYRQGFYRCADCDVELVSELPSEALATLERVQQPGDSTEDPFCSFWQGDDPRLHAEICQVLDEQGIPHKTVQRSDHLFNLSNYAAFQIGVPFSMFERAESAVKDAYGEEPEDLDPTQNLAAPSTLPRAGRSFKTLPPMLTPARDENLPGPPNAGDLSVGPYEDAAEVWSGEDAYLGDMIVAALHENQIHVMRRTVNGKQVLSVYASDEERAKEITREILDGEPPE